MLKKSLPISDIEFRFDSETGEFEGYASVFDNIDTYGDTILPGAFKRTLKENGLPKMFFNHELWGAPIGKWMSAKEDDKGLRVVGQLTDGNDVARNVGAALKHGTIDGLSIGFRTYDSDFKERGEGSYGRIYKRISTLVEVSVVTFPADTDARIELDSVKSALDEMQTVSDLEKFLREAGFSKQAAQHLLHASRSILSLREAGDEESEKKAAEEAARLIRLRVNNMQCHSYFGS